MFLSGGKKKRLKTVGRTRRVKLAGDCASLFLFAGKDNRRGGNEDGMQS